MKIKNKISTLLLFLLAIGSVYGQTLEHSFKRKLTGITEEWHKLVLPDEIYGNTSQDLSDLRIIGVTAEGDTIEAPYILNTFEDKDVTEEISFRIINESHNERGYLYTFETNSYNTINQIKLEFTEDNFDWLIKLEGSHSQQDWFSILEDYRILSIHNDNTDFSFTTLNFPLSKYQFYRLFIDSSKLPDLTNTTLQKHVRTNAVFNQYPIKEIVTNEISTDQTTEIRIELYQPLSVSSVEINIKESFDFYRPITIQYLADSLEVGNAWIFTYPKLTSGTLNSLKKNEFRFKSKITKRFKLSDIQQYLAHRARGWHYVNDTLVPVEDAMVIPPL